MANFEKLRYVRLAVTDPAAASDFATRVIGLEQVDAPEGLAMFRSDSRDHTLVVQDRAGSDAKDSAPQILALELRDPDALAALVARLETAGYAVHPGTDADCADRRCHQLAWFRIRDGVRIDLVIRPQDSGWRYHGTRDAGITEFFGIAFASTDIAADTELWTTILGGKVADYVGDAVYIAIDDEHHRIALHPSDRDAILEMQFRVEGLHQLMQNKYVMESMQVPVVHGPGRRATSEQLFLSYRGPDGMLFGLVSEGIQRDFNDFHLPRQFPRTASSFCTWGSESTVAEYSAPNLQQLKR